MSFNSWLNANALALPSIAVDTWIAVLQDPIVITLFRGNTITVRLAFDSSPRGDIVGNVSILTPRNLLLLGVYGHPDVTVVDTDIVHGDRFVYENDEFEVMDVIKVFGSVQAKAWRAGNAGA